MNEWTEIIITIDAKNIEVASDIAHMVVPYGIYVEDYTNLEQETWDIAHIDIIDEELLAKDRTKGIIHIYINPEENPNEAVSFLKERYEAVGIEYLINTNGIKQEDWANNWKKYFKPLPMGNKLLIQPTWIEDAELENRKFLRIDPGMAFGTGGHATTKLCLEVLENYVANGEEVLDVGCGSGILSIASMLLGAKNAVGVDIDEMAVKTAKENVKINGLTEDECKIVNGDLTDKITGKFDVVVANIVADVIIMFSSQVGDYMKDDAVFITSGIIDTREDDVISALVQNGFTIEKRFEDAGWLCLVSKLKK